VSIDGGGFVDATLDSATTWSRGVTLAEGLRGVKVEVTDLAGNVGSLVGSAGFDGTAPKLVVVDYSGVVDELPTNTGAGHCSINLQPSLAPDVDCAGSGDAINMSAQPSMTVERPTVHKFVTRLGAGPGEVGENPIEWRIAASDLGAGGVAGSGVDFAGSSYRVIDPTGAAGPVRTDFIDLPDTADVNDRAIRVTTASAGGLPLKTRAGVWRVEVTLVDAVARTRPPVATEMDWQHEPLGAPIFVALVGQPTASFLQPVSLFGMTLTNDSLAVKVGDLLQGVAAGQGRAVVEYVFENNTSEDTNVFLFTPPAAPGSVTATRTYADRSPLISLLTPLIKKPACALDLGSKFRIAPGPVVCSGTGGWSAPAPKDGDVSGGMPDPSVGFVDGVRVWEEVPGGGVEVAACAGCATSYQDGPVLRPGQEFTLKAGKRYHVVLVVNDLAFLRPAVGGGVSVTFGDFVAPKGGTVKVSGAVGEDWGECTQVDPDLGLCSSQVKYTRYQAIKQARVQIGPSALSIDARARPATTGTLAVTPQLAATGPITSGPQATWQVCEGTLIGDNCAVTPGAFP
jgi:hypothetical protein